MFGRKTKIMSVDVGTGKSLLEAVIIFNSSAHENYKLRTTVCRPVAKVGHLLDALQNYSAMNCFKNSITKVILYLKA